MEKQRKLLKAKIKKNDNVIILSGKDKGKIGKVLKVDYKNAKIIVEGVNIVKKTVRPSQQNPSGGIIELEAPIHISKVMIVCPNCNKRTRVKIDFTSQGKKVRACKKCNTPIDKI
jgi:large subunit ribosomal protein L24